MGKKKQNVLINDLDIDDNLLTDDDKQSIKQHSNSNSLRSRQGKKKKKLNNKVISDENLINISDFDTSSSISDSDHLNNDQNKTDSLINNNEFNLLDNYLNKTENSDSDNDFKYNLDLNLKKKKRIFLSNDRTDFLNFILSEQQKIKKNTTFNSLFTSYTTNQFKSNNFKLTPLNHKSNNHLNTDEDFEEDDDDINSEFNLLLNSNHNNNNNSLNDLNSEFADDEDDGLNYLDYLNSRSTNRRFKHFYNYFKNLFHFRTHVKSSNLLFNNNINLKTNLNQYNLPTSSQFNLSDNELDDLNLDNNFLNFKQNTSSYSFLNKFRLSLSNFIYYFLNLINLRQNNQNNYSHKLFKQSTLDERVDLLKNDTNASSDDFNKDDYKDDGWYDGEKEMNSNLLKNNKPKLLLQQKETMFSIMFQVFIPFLVAGLFLINFIISFELFS